MPGPGGMGLLDMMSDAPAPPPNQQVLDYIAGLRSQYEGQGAAPLREAGLPTQWDPSMGGGYTSAAAQPGLSGYFDYDPSRGGVVPRMMDARQVAADTGASFGQLAGSVLPGGGYGNVGYNLPNDRGGFFSTEQLWNASGRGSTPIGGAGQIGGQLPSTNNWRLLGRGPGWIMRNGQMINTRSPGLKYGQLAGAALGSGGTAESGAMGYIPFVAPGNALTGASLNDRMYWPGASEITGYTRWPFGTDV